MALHECHVRNEDHQTLEPDWYHCAVWLWWSLDALKCRLLKYYATGWLACWLSGFSPPLSNECERNFGEQLVEIVPPTLTKMFIESQKMLLDHGHFLHKDGIAE